MAVELRQGKGKAEWGRQQEATGSLETIWTEGFREKLLTGFLWTFLVKEYLRIPWQKSWAKLSWQRDTKGVISRKLQKLC